MHGGISRVPLSSAASTADGTWCTVYGSGTDPDNYGQIYCIISIDFIPFLICCQVFSLVVLVSQRDSSYALTIVAVQSQYTRASLDHAQHESAGRSYCDHSTSCVSADRQQTYCTAIEKLQ